MEEFTINMEVSEEDWNKFCLHYESLDAIADEVMRQLADQSHKWANGEKVRLRYRPPRTVKKSYIEVREVLPDGKTDTKGKLVADS